MTALTPLQKAERETWQYRAVLKTRGNQTLPGCILLAVLQRSPQHGPPRFGVEAIIDKDGYVRARYQGRDRKITEGALVCQVSELIDAFRKLAEKCKMSNTEAEDMFLQIRQWIKRDDRVTAAPVFTD